MGAARTSGERVATSRIDGIMLKVNVFDEFEGGNTALLYLKMLLIAMVDYLSFVWNMGYEEKWIQYYNMEVKWNLRWETIKISGATADKLGDQVPGPTFFAVIFGRDSTGALLRQEATFTMI
jgi:hypothetical protein